MSTFKRGPIHRLLYSGRYENRPDDISMWLFYLLAPIYAIHWFFGRWREYSSLKRALISTRDNFRLSRHFTRTSPRNRPPRRLSATKRTLPGTNVTLYDGPDAAEAMMRDVFGESDDDERW